MPFLVQRSQLLVAARPGPLRDQLGSEGGAGEPTGIAARGTESARVALFATEMGVLWDRWIRSVWLPMFPVGHRTGRDTSLGARVGSRRPAFLFRRLDAHVC